MNKSVSISLSGSLWELGNLVVPVHLHMSKYLTLPVFLSVALSANLFGFLTKYRIITIGPFCC